MHLKRTVRGYPSHYKIHLICTMVGAVGRGSGLEGPASLLQVH